MKKFYFIATIVILSMTSFGQTGKQVTRIAILTIDSLQLKTYMAHLKEQMETAVRLEPGVISYTVYTDKQNPAKITLIEVYADNAAYLKHREAPHFIKYKTATAAMVKSLELSEVETALTARKEKLHQ